MLWRANFRNRSRRAGNCNIWHPKISLMWLRQHWCISVTINGSQVVRRDACSLKVWRRGCCGRCRPLDAWIPLTVQCPARLREHGRWRSLRQGYRATGLVRSKEQRSRCEAIVRFHPQDHTFRNQTFQMFLFQVPKIGANLDGEVPGAESKSNVGPFQSLSDWGDWLRKPPFYAAAPPLPVLIWNDDEIAPNTGFPPHSHINTGFITVCPRRAVSHRDSLGNEGTYRRRRCSGHARRGGTASSTLSPILSRSTRLFQIWIKPKG